MAKENNRIHIINFTPRQYETGTPWRIFKWSDEEVKWSNTNIKFSEG